MTEPETESTRKGAVKRMIDRAKQHTVIVLIVTLMGIGAFAIKAQDVFVWARDNVSAIVNPHATEYAALATLDLDIRPEFFEANFGTAKRMFNLCKEAIACPAKQGDEILMYIHETVDVEVRAVFEGERLEMYSVTLQGDQMSPMMEWNGWTLGGLGEVTYAQALGVVDAIDGPSDAQIFLGPQASAYAEVVAGGASAHYRGLLLANGPTGYAGPRSSFDLDSGHQLQESQDLEQPPYAAALTRFRAGSKPNTFGEFRDDGGVVGNLLEKAENLIPLLFVGTER